jgi:hypothetical protein
MANLDLVATRVAELGGTVVTFNEAGVVLWSAQKRTSQGMRTLFNTHNVSFHEGKADLYWGHYDMELYVAVDSMDRKVAQSHC